MPSVPDTSIGPPISVESVEMLVTVPPPPPPPPPPPNPNAMPSKFILVLFYYTQKIFFFSMYTRPNPKHQVNVAIVWQIKRISETIG
jgi:hypothetical protein